MHNFCPKFNHVENFSSLSLKATEKSTRQIFVNSAGGGGNAA
jgi:hypothetical protein